MISAFSKRGEVKWKSDSTSVVYEIIFTLILNSELTPMCENSVFWGVIGRVFGYSFHSYANMD